MDETLLERRMKGWIYEAGVDVLGLWELCRAARYDWDASAPEEVKSLVLSFVQKLLKEGLQAIDIGSGKPWTNQDPEIVIDRISREWDALGREPSVPDIVWFKLLCDS